MSTVFSHIVQKRFSNVNEDIATDALAYILESSESARKGMMKILRGILPGLPDLRFKTQQTEGAIRPDMWGFVGNQPRVFVENKFWAGLTDNQPVCYLKQLSAQLQPTVLLVIAPAGREQTLWRELNHRLAVGGVSTTARSEVAAVPCLVDTQTGPTLALTSWASVLSLLAHECADDSSARNDLIQLRALCASADSDAFKPVSRVELSDQRAPAFVLQMSSIIQSVVDLAAGEKIIITEGLRPQASWERIGRYIRISGDASRGAGAWFGIHFDLWKAHGVTPLWLVFYDTAFGRGQEVRSLIEPWAAMNGVLTVKTSYGFAMALEVLEGEEKDAVVRSLVDGLGAVAEVLDELPPMTKQDCVQEEQDENSC